MSDDFFDDDGDLGDDPLATPDVDNDDLLGDVDLADVPERVHVSPDEYTVKVCEITARKQDYTEITVKFKIVGGKHEGVSLVDRFRLDWDNAKARLADFAQAIGAKGANGKFNLSPGTVTGKTCKVKTGKKYDEFARSSMIVRYVLPPRIS